jgi:hypothetical protein
VEIKTFQGISDVRELEEALGQYLIYETFLQRYQPDRVLYLALTREPHERLFDETLGQTIMERFQLKLLVFEPSEEAISLWIPEP